MKRQINCGFANGVRLVTFRQFLDMLPVDLKHKDVRRYEFNTVTRYAFGDACLFPYMEDETSYTRKSVPLLKGHVQTICHTALRYQAGYGYVHKASLNEIFSEMCLNHATNLGQAKCLVRVGPRDWMPANPEDFRVVTNDHGVGLACFNVQRTVIYTVLKYTAEDIQTVVNKISENLRNSFKDQIVGKESK